MQVSQRSPFMAAEGKQCGVKTFVLYPFWKCDDFEYSSVLL